MKTVAQSLREFMDSIREAFSPYDFEMIIKNPVPFPENGTDDEKDNWEETIKIGVDYTVTTPGLKGSITGSDYDYPDEDAEVELTAVYNADTGEDIADLMTDEITQEIEDAVMDHIR